MEAEVGGCNHEPPFEESCDGATKWQLRQEGATQHCRGCENRKRSQERPHRESLIVLLGTESLGSKTSEKKGTRKGSGLLAKLRQKNGTPSSDLDSSCEKCKLSAVTQIYGGHSSILPSHNLNPKPRQGTVNVLKSRASYSEGPGQAEEMG